MWTSNNTIKFKIKNLITSKEYNQLSFGQRIEVDKKLKEFRDSSKSVWLSKKRQSATKAINEAIKLYDVREYYCKYADTPNYSDDSFEFWYK